MIIIIIIIINFIIMQLDYYIILHGSKGLWLGGVKTLFEIFKLII